MFLNYFKCDQKQIKNSQRCSYLQSVREHRVPFMNIFFNNNNNNNTTLTLITLIITTNKCNSLFSVVTKLQVLLNVKNHISGLWSSVIINYWWSNNTLISVGRYKMILINHNSQKMKEKRMLINIVKRNNSLEITKA